jgi:hypothetical protein
MQKSILVVDYVSQHDHGSCQLESFICLYVAGWLWKVDCARTPLDPTVLHSC